MAPPLFSILPNHFMHSQLKTFLLATLSGAVILAVSFVALTQSVQYKPYGVPDARREEYETRLANLRSSQNAIFEAKKTNSGRIEIAETSYDFGQMPSGSFGLTHSFRVINTGNGPLTLEPDGSTCKCAEAEIADKLIQPGEETMIKLVWNIGRDVKEEHYKQVAYVKTNDPNREQLDLTVHGQVTTRFAADGEHFARRKIIGSKPVSGYADVYSATFESFEILRISSTDESMVFTPDFLSKERLSFLEAKSGYRVSALVPEVPAASKKVHETVTVVLFDPEEKKEIELEVPFSAERPSPIVFHGNELRSTGYDLGVIEIGTSKTWSFIARFRTDFPVKQAKVKAIKPDGLIAEIKPSKRVANTFSVTLSVDPDAEPNIFNADTQGFIEIVAANDASLSDWMPLQGSLVDLE